ncbi:MAG: hypothetical protein R3C61_24275 [Bacteroidia bacterium]
MDNLIVGLLSLVAEMKKANLLSDIVFSPEGAWKYDSLTNAYYLHIRRTAA